MATCKYCGAPINWARLDGNNVPIHPHGGWECAGSRGQADASSDTCFLTNCPYCSQEVWFIRYNGGCVWVDELGWPWQKHIHCTSVSEPWWWPIVRKQGERGHTLQDAMRSLERGELGTEKLPARAPRVHPNVPGADCPSEVVQFCDIAFGTARRRIWVVRDNRGEQVASFEYRDREAANAYAVGLIAETGIAHYVEGKDVLMPAKRGS